MKTLRRRAFLFFTLVLLAAVFPSARAADTNLPPRLTIELRDGSRVVGTSVEKNFKFHSDLLGEIKLEVKDIRLVECISSNAATLTTANGDTLAVQFADSAFAVKTSFGRVELAADSIRELTVLVSRATGTHPPGLVSLWSGEDNGRDSIGNNPAILTDISLAEDEVGRSFVFNGSTSNMRVPARPSLNVGLGEGLTLEAWINPANQKFQEICEWDKNDGVPSVAAQIGTHMEINDGPGDGSFWGGVVDTTGVAHNLYSANGIIIPNTFQHIAMTYDKSSGVAVLYWNGVVVATANLGVFTPQTSFDFFIGTRPSGVFSGIYFQGRMNDISIYNRALSASEIQAICTEQNNGEPLPPPTPSPRNIRRLNGFGNAGSVY